MSKFNLSRIDRTVIFNIIPKVGNLETIRNAVSYMAEVKFTEEENKIDASFNQIHDPKEREVARQAWYETPEEFELSDGLADLIRADFKSREASKAFDLKDHSPEFIAQFL